MSAKPTTSRRANTFTARPVRTVFDATDVTRRRIAARYDAARTTDENAKLWEGADALSAAAANSPAVRKTLRERARLEVSNNSYAEGIVGTLANDTIGPSIQIQLGDTVDVQKVETDFQAWATAVGLWEKLRTMHRARVNDGEVFGLLFTNPLVEDDIKLDVRPIECDMVEGWGGNIGRDDEIDGIRFDAYGNPIMYRLLKTHPGDHRMKLALGGDWIKRKFMLHYFTPTRPGQVRGVSEICSALSLFGQLRRYTAAVIEAASRAAEISAVMQTDLLPDQVAAELADPLTVIEAERNAIVSLPEGWKLAQLKAEQPTTTYPQFKGEIINEMARGKHMPYNVAAGNSSDYNYASGRLDFQTYDRSITVERTRLEDQVLRRIYVAWLEEYAARRALSAVQRAAVASPTWHYTGRGHVDPAKEANADSVRLGNGTLTYADYWARQGADWKRKEAQRIRELIQREVMWNAARAEANLPPAPYPATTTQPMAPDPEDPPPAGKRTSEQPQREEAPHEEEAA